MTVFIKLLKIGLCFILASILAIIILIAIVLYIDGREFNKQMEREKQPMILNKNSQGEYRLVVRLSESFATTTQRNPNFFVRNDYDGYPLFFMRPILPFKEIPNVRVEILNQDYELAFNATDFQDLLFVNDDYPEVQVGHFLGDFRATNNIGRSVKASTAMMEQINEIENSTNLSDEEKSKQINILTQSFEEQEKLFEIEASKKIYQQYQDIIAILKKYGWKPYIHPYSPRVLGEASWSLQNEPSLVHKDGYGVLIDQDGYYIDSYEKWKQHTHTDEDTKDDIFAMFYHKNLIMQLAISDAYPRIEIETNTYAFLGRYDEFTRAEKWLEYLASDIPKWQAKRQEAEDILRAKGYTIDESYVDAPLPKEFIDYQKMNSR